MVSLRRRLKTGRFSIENAKTRFWRAVNKTDKCWEWSGCRHYKGYGEFIIEGKNKTKAHRFSWFLAHGKIPDGMLVLHKCDNPPCVRPDHLFLGTPKTNRQDCNSKMRHCYGQRMHTAKLTEGDVIEIRKADLTNRTRLSIAEEFGISGRQVTAICRRENWKHVK